MVTGSAVVPRRTTREPDLRSRMVRGTRQDACLPDRHSGASTDQTSMSCRSPR